MSFPSTCKFCGGSMEEVDSYHPDFGQCSSCGAFYEDDSWVKPSTRPRSGKKSVPTVCEDCGGPYPLCKDGCAIFDDD